MREREIGSRITAKTAALAAEGRPALVTFLTAGDPDLALSLDLLRALPGAGADMIELGIPFSDPMAEGPPIQASSQRALKGGQTMARTFSMVRAFRAEDGTTPLVLMGYYNPIYRYGVSRFVTEAREAGVDGLIVVDLPPEEDAELRLPATAAGLALIRLVAPTTDENRLSSLLSTASGFIYYVSIAGVTGAAAAEPEAVLRQVARIKQKTALPVMVGFGIRRPEQAARIGAGADGVVVGSALVEAVRQSLDGEGRGGAATKEAVTALVAALAAGLRSARTDQG